MADIPENEGAMSAKDIKQKMRDEGLSFHMTGDGGELRIVSGETHDANPLNPVGKEGGVFRAIPNFNPTDHPIVDSAGEPFPGLEDFSAYSTGKPDKRQLLVNLKTGEVFQPEAFEVDGEKKITLHHLSNARQTHLGVSEAKPQRKKMTFSANGAGEFKVEHVDVLDDGVLASNKEKNPLFLVQAKEKNAGKNAPLKTFAMMQETGTVYEVENIERLSGGEQTYKRAIKLGDAVGVFNGGWKEHCCDAFRAFNKHQGPGVVARTKSTVVGMMEKGLDRMENTLAAGVTMASKGVRGVGTGAAKTVDVGGRALRRGARFAVEDLPQAVRSHKSEALGLVIGSLAWLGYGSAAQAFTGGTVETVGEATKIVLTAAPLAWGALAGLAASGAGYVMEKGANAARYTTDISKKAADRLVGIGKWVKNIGADMGLGSAALGTAAWAVTELLSDGGSPIKAAVGAVMTGILGGVMAHRAQRAYVRPAIAAILTPEIIKHYDYPEFKGRPDVEEIRPGVIHSEELGIEQPAIRTKQYHFENGYRVELYFGDEKNKRFEQVKELFRMGEREAERNVVIERDAGGNVLRSHVKEVFPGLGGMRCETETHIEKKADGGYDVSRSGAMNNQGAAIPPEKRHKTISGKEVEVLQARVKASSRPLGFYSMKKAVMHASVGVAALPGASVVKDGISAIAKEDITLEPTKTLVAATVLWCATSFLNMITGRGKMVPGTHAQKVVSAQAQHADDPTRTLGGGTAPAR